MDRAEAVLTAQADATLDAVRPDFTQLEDVEAIVAHDLAEPIHQLFLLGKDSAQEEYVEAVNLLWRRFASRYQDI